MKITFKRGQKKKSKRASGSEYNFPKPVSLAPLTELSPTVDVSYKEVTSFNSFVGMKIFGINGFDDIVVEPLENIDKNLVTLNNILSKRLLKASCKRNVVMECGLYIEKHLRIGRISVTRFQEAIVFPVRYSHLTPDSYIKIRIYSILTPYYRLKMGTFRIDIFTTSGILKTGNYRVRLYHKESILTEKKMLGTFPESDLNWLNKKTQKHIKGKGRNPLSAFHPKRRVLESGEEIVLKLQFPIFPYDVVHPERYFEAVEKRVMTDTSLPVTNFPPPKKKSRRRRRENTSKRKNAVRSSGQILDLTFDPDSKPVEDTHIAMSNPTEEKFFKLFTHMSRFDTSFIKPNTNDLKKIQKLIDRTPLYPINLKHKYLLWKYRRYLMTNKRALVKFLKTVEWNDDKEYNEAKYMVENWAEIDDVDALECLGYYFAQVPFIREYAVNRLKKLDDVQVREILLQLVQSLRYEKETILKGNDSTCSPLVEFLLERSCKNFVIANFFEWHLRSEFEDPNYQDLYKKVHQLFRDLMVKEGKSDFFTKLDKQKVFVEELRSICAKIKKQGRGRNDRISRLQKSLGEPIWTEFFKKSPMESLVEPGVEICGFRPQMAFIYKSNLAPWLVPMIDMNDKTLRMIYKKGNDLKQEQLVVQIFRLMDNILKRNALDLKLTPFEILACSSTDGFVQFIHPSESLFEIIYKEKKTIKSWLAEKNRTQEQFNQSCDNFIRSSAGYCVITYLLGIGDRHLENILIQNNGKMFHIDFDYILGRDPKKYPPPMKIAPQMVDALKSMRTLGGENGYTKFIELCCSSYNVMRRYSSLILNLFILMLDSNIPDLKAKGSNRMQKLNKIKEKLKLSLSDNEAIRAMRLIIKESEKALFSKINEALHRYAQYWRE